MKIKRMKIKSKKIKKKMKKSKEIYMGKIIKIINYNY